MDPGRLGVLQVFKDLQGQLPALAGRRAVTAVAHHPDAAADRRSGAWRILVGEDASWLDTRVNANPEAAYDDTELFGTSQDPASDVP